MKKLFLSLTLLSFCASAFAQGSIKFANRSTANELVKLYDYNYNSVVADSASFHVALYWGVLGATEAQLVQIGPGGIGDTSGTTGGLNPALPGRFSNGTTFNTGAATAPGATATFQVRGWTGNYTTYEAAYAAADRQASVGASALFASPTGGDTQGGTQPPSVPPANLGTNFNGLFIGPIPEPSTLALAGLGGAALLLFRRRK